jgi:hypothetical protein
MLVLPIKKLINVTIIAGLKISYIYMLILI